MSDSLKFALAGLGTVGSGVIRLIETNRELIRRRAGKSLEIVAVSARERGKDRGVDISPYDWADDMSELAARADVDVVVELVGGSDGPALALARKTLGSGKALVTANKAMVAHHGLELAAIAEEHRVPLKFEAAVAGGIPVIKAIREGAAANAITRLYGILNGTCNYILSVMEDSGRSFDEVLADAQQLGYAEADPAFDIDGVDAAHKLAILSSIAFGTSLDFDSVEHTGIRRVLAADIEQAEALGYRIRLIGTSEIQTDSAESSLFQRVQLCLVPESHVLAHVDGPTNAVVCEGNFVGQLLFQGPGAGDGPTASAVVADLIDIARGEASPPFSINVSELRTLSQADSGKRIGKSYIRFIVADRPGVLAEITAAMRDEAVSIESLIQKSKTEGGSALLSMVVHECPEGNVRNALAKLGDSASLIEEPFLMEIIE